MYNALCILLLNHSTGVHDDDPAAMIATIVTCTMFSFVISHSSNNVSKKET